MDLEYKVIYSDRKTLSLIVERDRSVVVRAPKGMTEEHIHQVVEEKRLWLYEKMKHPAKYPLQTVRKEFVSGETLLYLGRNYRLELTDENFSEVRFHSCFIISRSQRVRAKDLLQEWYMQRAIEKLVPKVEHYARAMGVGYNKILVSNLKYSWATCTLKKNLNFNWRIIRAPMAVIEYVIIHELAHLLELNHSERFWNVVAIQLPDYDRAKEWLRENGERLEEEF